MSDCQTFTRPLTTRPLKYLNEVKICSSPISDQNSCSVGLDFKWFQEDLFFLGKSEFSVTVGSGYSGILFKT